jgi:hypothetical protein
MNLELDDVCDYVLSKIAKRDDGEYYELYPYFDLPNGELISDNGMNPKRVVSEFEKYGLSKPLENERCELTELGIKIGQGIGFKKHKENEEKKKSNKETIEKRKDDNVNFDYFIKRPYIMLLFLIAILTPFGLNKCSKEEANITDKEHVEDNKHQPANTIKDTISTNQKQKSLIHEKTITDSSETKIDSL